MAENVCFASVLAEFRKKEDLLRAKKEYKRWKQAQAVASHVCKRWIKEYLPEIIQRKKWHEDPRNVQVGDLVRIVDLVPAVG